MKKGGSLKAEKYLKEAVHINPNVVNLLLSNDDILVPSVCLDGGELDAISYTYLNKKHWKYIILHIFIYLFIK